MQIKRRGGRVGDAAPRGKVAAGGQSTSGRDKEKARAVMTKKGARPAMAVKRFI